MQVFFYFSLSDKILQYLCCSFSQNQTKLVMQQEIKKQKIVQEKCGLKITRIIPKSSRTQLTLVPYVIITAESKKANQIINALKQIEKQNEKQVEGQYKMQKKEEEEEGNVENLFLKEKEKPFLKRVRKSGDKIQALICKDSCENKESILARLEKLNLIEKIQIKHLPSQAPITKAQFQQWSQLWPINFILHEIAKQIPHTSTSIELLNSLLKHPEDEDQFYLLDHKGEKILLSNSGQCKQLTIAHPIMQLLKQWSLCDQFRSKPQKYYYLTGLKMFIRKEICGMCSMALVHSRLSSIYMGFKIPQVMDTIMGCRKLNHQIKMFYLQ